VADSEKVLAFHLYVLSSSAKTEKNNASNYLSVSRKKQIKINSEINKLISHTRLSK
jgi:hypothetical protein